MVLVEQFVRQGEDARVVFGWRVATGCDVGGDAVDGVAGVFD